MSSVDTICPQCARINFDFFTQPLVEGQHSETLPDISWTVFSPETCQFCQLLLHCRFPGGDIHHPLQGTLRGVYAGHELQIHMDDGQTSTNLNYSIRHCKPPPASFPNEELQASVSFDVNELKDWLKQCKKHKCLPWLEECEKHECMPPDNSLKPLPEDFRLIDVDEYRIVQPKKQVEYCALSYVWGGKEQPLLKSSNKDKAEMRNFLTGLDLPLPRTILDAIALCRGIGCHFLWVDSLCIVQDCKENKYSQISSMADIYSLSYLAIVAAAGEDSSAGLAPYGRRNPDISYLLRTTSNGSFVASLSPQLAAQEISKSAWASRGWTLQEYALSRRVLFFTGSYAFLRCEHSLRCEDFGLGFSDCFGEARKWDLPLPPFYRRIKSPHRHYPSTFSQLVAQFVRRNLSYEKDVLNAFTGILTQMEDRELGQEGIGNNIWGLPSKQFGAALQWTTHLPWPSTERVGFPSWSWAGWIHTNDSLPLRKGSFHDIYEGFDDQVADISVLTCYKIHDNGSIQTIEDCDFERIFRHLSESSDDAAEISRFERLLRRHFTPQPCEILISTYIQEPNPSKPPLSHHIFLWASCASLYVDPPLDVVYHPATYDFPIRIHKGGPQIGSIRLKPKWREKEPTYMHFFVSTTGIYSNSGQPRQRGFKVILTKLYQNARLPVYKRIQVSNTAIRQMDWMRAKPESRFIALV